MSQNLQNNQKQLRLVMVALWAFAFPLIWYFSTPRADRNWNGHKDTERRLAQTQRAVESYRKKYKRLPDDVADVRLHAKRFIRKNYVPYDGYGRRIQYLTLSPDHYVIRSYGEDGNDQRFHSPEDPTISSLPKLPLLPPQYKEPEQAAMRLYPAVLLNGNKSPRNNLVAQLLVDYDGQKRQLIVRDLKRPRFSMIANHPGVEEFFWLPSGYEIVFTATQADKYQDGIFVWNVLTNELRNLMNDYYQIFNVAQGQHMPEFYLSLSSVDKAGHFFYAFIAQKRDVALEPERFFTDDFFYKVTIPKKQDSKVTFELMKGKAPPSLFYKIPETVADVYTPFIGTESQLEWSRLPTVGAIQYVIEKWQEFSVNNARSPMFPYSLWWLSSIYSDSYRLLVKKDKNDANTLRAYGAELARALSRLSMAPSYLRAMGESVSRRLAAAEPLPYRMSLLSIYEIEAGTLPRP